MKTRKRIMRVMTIAVLLGVSNTSNAAVPHVFTAGSAARAVEVNNNFNNLDQRVTSLEGSATGGQTIAVDCDTDATALKNLTASPNTTYVLTGICDGPIRFGAGLGTINVQGDATGTRDDGISQPSGLSNPDTDFAAISGTNGVRLNLENLVLSADNYIGASDFYVSTVQASRGAHLTLTNVDVRGGDTGVSAWNGYVSVNQGVTVTGFRDAGLSSGLGGTLHTWEPTTVTGGTSLEGSSSTALVAYRNGVLEVTQGGTFTAGTSDGSVTPFYPEALVAVDNGSIRVSNSGTVTFTGSVGAYRSSSVHMQAGTVTGHVDSGENSAVRFENVTQSGGYISSYRNSTFRASNSSLVGGIGDLIDVGAMSTMRLDDTVVGNADGVSDLVTYSYGYVTLRGTTNLSNRNITCNSLEALDIRNTVTNVGTISCAP